MDASMTAAPAADQAATAVSAGTSESAAINELATALAKAQGAFSNPEKDRRNPHFGSCYATLGAVIEATRKALAENGPSLTQTVGGRPPCLRSRLLHSSGQWLASEVPLFTAGKGSQVFGSELTYMRRYAVCALLNIAPAEGDDDGNAAQVAMGTGASSPQAPRSEARPGDGGKPAAARGSSESARPPSRAKVQVQDAQPDPAGAPRQNGQKPASAAQGRGRAAVGVGHPAPGQGGHHRAGRGGVAELVDGRRRQGRGRRQARLAAHPLRTEHRGLGRDRAWLAGGECGRRQGRRGCQHRSRRLNAQALAAVQPPGPSRTVLAASAGVGEEPGEGRQNSQKR